MEGFVNFTYLGNIASNNGGTCEDIEPMVNTTIIYHMMKFKEEKWNTKDKNITNDIFVSKTWKGTSTSIESLLHKPLPMKYI